VIGEYTGAASAESYQMVDGSLLNLSEKDQKWPGISSLSGFSIHREILNVP